jgi:hypothetical protein
LVTAPGLWVGGLSDFARRGLSVLGHSPGAPAAQLISSKPSTNEQPRRTLGPVDEADQLATVEFEVTFEDGHELSQSKQDEFKTDFAGDLARLSKWADEHRWPFMVRRKLQVVVSRRYRISKSLVPAWYGRPGDMEFPAWRVAGRRAAIAHELVHVFFPNANRLLAEGLAVYLQSEIGGNPAFPNFGQPLHECARERAGETGFEPLQFIQLDAVATPGPLELRIGPDFYGEEPRGQSCLYAFAGSFVQFLIETQGLAAFRRLYLQTPMVPLQQNAGSSGRWNDAYRRPLADLAAQWKSVIDGTAR